FKDATVSVLFGKGDGTLQSAAPYPVGAGPESLAAVQAAQSAPVDLVTTNGNSGSSPMGSDVTVLRNLAAPATGTSITIDNVSPPNPTYGDVVTFSVSVIPPIGGKFVVDDITDPNNPPIQLCGATVASGAGMCSTDPNNLLSAGDHTVTATFTPGDIGHSPSTSAPVTFTVAQADPVIVVTGYSVPYDAQPWTAKVTKATCGGLDVTMDVDVSGTTHTDANNYPNDPWTFTDPNNNCKTTPGTVKDVISPAPPLIITAKNESKIYGQTFTFDGSLGAGEFTVTGLFSRDSVTSVTLMSDGAPSNAHVTVKPYPIIPSSAIGIGLSNYVFPPMYANGLLTVTPAQPLFSALTGSQTIIQGLTSIMLSGTVCATDGACPPQGDPIVVMISGQSQMTKVVDNKGSFSYLTYPTAPIAAGVYPIAYSYNTSKSNSDFLPGGDSTSTSLIVQDYTWNSTPAPPGITFVTQGFKNSDSQSYNQNLMIATATPLPMNPPGIAFSGNIALDCMVKPLQGQSSNLPTCSLNPGMLTNGAYGATVTVAAQGSTPIGFYDISVPSTTPRSDKTLLTHSTDLTVGVVALITGQSVTSTSPATPAVPFVGMTAANVNFSCTSITGPDGKTFAYGSPGDTYNVTCTVPGGPITLSTNPASPTTVTVTISAHTQTARLLTPGKFLATFWMGMPAVVLLGSWRFRRASRRRMWQSLVMMLIVIGLLQIVACGGGFNRSALSTMPGAYTILIQGTDAGNNSLVQTTAIIQFTVLPGS
ncbi:MAG: Ig-like domain-containing protein, partial [Candidatus Korobacteraceae bacterium]